ncbi:nadh-ubiquinone oxidoreductase mitochondrial [Myxozyma melibiosi]|uniref:Nadh-ubiquinone oxidoreductase mitochondrial n=1 Tax=Myxozyma melibiosi TaxID=54550 RepID=A0ABR1FAK2_9ASCO
MGSSDATPFPLTLNDKPEGENKFPRYKKVSFDEIDYSDPSQLKAAQMSEVQHQWVKLYAMRTVRKALQMCYDTKGVNHIEDCRELALRYTEMLPSHRLHGYTGVQRNDPSK